MGIWFSLITKMLCSRTSLFLLVIFKTDVTLNQYVSYLGCELVLSFRGQL